MAKVENAMDKRAYAQSLFSQGYNCAQAVLLAFQEEAGLDWDTAARLASSFGAGMGRLREVCGAVSAMFMVIGLRFGYATADQPEEKAAHYRRIQFLAQQFREKRETLICRELLQGVPTTAGVVPEERTREYYARRPCRDIIGDAAEILERF